MFEVLVGEVLKAFAGAMLLWGIVTLTYNTSITLLLAIRQRRRGAGD